MRHAPVLRVVSTALVLSIFSTSSTPATPAGGTLSPSSATLTFATNTTFNGTYEDPTASPPEHLTCDATHPCDDYNLTVDLPSGYAAAHPNATIVVTTTWSNPVDDFDVYWVDNGQYPYSSAASGPSPETFTVPISAIPGGGGTPLNVKIRVTLFTDAVGPGEGQASTSIVLKANDSTPTGASGTVSPSTPVQTHDAGPFTSANPTPDPGGVDNGPRCNTTTTPCDSYALTVDLPSGYKAANPHAAVKVSLGWTDSGTGNSDYDLYVFTGDVPTTNGSQTATYHGGGQDNPEVATMFPIQDGTHLFTVKIVPYTPTGEVVHLRMELFAGAPGGVGGNPGPCDTDVFGNADKACAGNPRYQTFFAPHGTTAEAGSQGEYNIGYNPKSGRIMNMNIGPIWRITPAEVTPGGGPLTDSGMPESCPELWEDVSDPSTDTGLDPILITDPVSGRTFATNSTAGGAAIYTDDDGGDPPANDAPNPSWLQSVQPPNGGADHETFGVGPLPASLASLSNPTNQGQWVVYCSQDLAAPSMCQRSLTLGTSYDNPTPGTGLACSGLHGHARIAPDGTAWLPVKNCGATAGGSISIDSSVSPWTEFTVQKAAADADGPAFTTAPQGNGADPSIGLDANSTAYYCYVNNEGNPAGTEGHVHVAVGKRQPGTTTIKWIRDVDVGTTHGIVNAAHTEAVAGSAGRAACGFIGTNVPGNYQAGDFTGVWYPFIATTYDEGRTWTLVNASPNDPDQFATGVWQQGGSGDNGDRNLLDFNEMTMDEKGRPLYGHSDGCVSASCILDGTGNDKTAYMRVSRQIGGKTLLAAFDGQTDTTTPIKPKRACLNGSTRDDTTAHLVWRVPDNGGAAITNYEIWRSTSKGGPYAQIATTVNDKPVYFDSSAGNADSHLYYVIKAINSIPLTSDFSNEEDLTITPPPPVTDLCILPGLLELTDPVGTGGTAPAGSAGPGMDLLTLNVAQPYPSDGVPKLYFTIGTDNGVQTQPAGSTWYASFKIAGPDPAIAHDTQTSHYRAVRMTWSGPTPTFEYYTPSASNAGTVDGRFATAGSNHPADAASSYATPYNKVVIVVKASDLGLAPGDTIINFVSAVTVTTGGVITGTVDEMPSGLGYSGGPYTVTPADYCAPNDAPIVDTFLADPASGGAPLTVTFTATAHDPNTSNPTDSVASYTFDFGDGTAPVTQASPTIQYTYINVGNYVAKAKAKDSRNLASINSKTQLITVGVPSVTASVGNNRLGGGLPPAGILVLGMFGLLRIARKKRLG